MWLLIVVAVLEVHANLYLKHRLLCKDCIYLTEQNGVPGAYSVHVTSLKGGGRTGNIVTSVIKAFHYAQLCRGFLQLPRVTSTLEYGTQGVKFDFTKLQLDTPNTTCISLKGNSGFFFRLEIQGAQYKGFKGVASECIRWYLGICNSDFCDGTNKFEGKTIVAHVRQGDIFPPDFSQTYHIDSFFPQKVNKHYDQPPWSYYLAAIQEIEPNYVIFVGEPTNTHLSPIWLAAHLLERHNISKPKFLFQSGSFEHDVKTLMCAEILVESHSTLQHLTSLGFASTVFSHSCRTQPFAQVFQINFVHKYHMKHTNSRAEWVDLLLMESSNVSKCNINPDSPLLTDHGKKCEPGLVFVVVLLFCLYIIEMSHYSRGKRLKPHFEGLQITDRVPRMRQGPIPVK